MRLPAITPRFHHRIAGVALPRTACAIERRAIRTTSTSPIMLVAMTGYGRKEDRDQAIAAGFDLHFAKPVQATRLRELVDRVRARRAAA